MKSTLLKAGIIAAGLLGSAVAFADDARHNLISFEVSVQEEVANDEAMASLNKTLSAKTPKELATKLTPIINQAITIAKKYPTVQVATGSQHAYPDYSKGKIVGVTGSASITLKSKDTEALSDLLAELQNILVLESLDFSVSDELQDKTSAALQAKATQKFQAEAKALSQLWGASGYTLVNAQMNTNGRHYHRKQYAYDAMAAVEQSASAPRQTLEAGNSTISYTINGTIQLNGRW